MATPPCCGPASTRTTPGPRRPRAAEGDAAVGGDRPGPPRPPANPSDPQLAYSLLPDAGLSVHDRGQPLLKRSALVEESSLWRCDLRFMSDQLSQRRYLCWFWVLVVLVMVVAVPVVLGAHHYQRGVEGRCAVHVEHDKPELAGYHWSWWWLPGWVCEFERDGRRWDGVCLEPESAARPASPRPTRGLCCRS